MVLKVDNVHVYYGESHILHGITLNLEKGEIVGLIGNNGMGKTTLIRSIMGLTDIRSGSIHYQDTDISHLNPYKIARMGISFIPENREIFPELSVYENIHMGSMINRKNYKINYNKIYDYFPVLKDRLKQKGGTLSGGEQQMLAVARGLVGDPDLILIDEFSEGLHPLMIQNIVGILREVQKAGKTILMVEQNARLALSLSRRIYILEKGQVSYHGFSEELLANAEVLKEYLAI